MKLKSLLSVLLLSTSLIAFAEDAPKKEAAAPAAPVFQEAGYNFVGVSLGIAKPVGSNLSLPLRFNFGAEYTYALMKDVAIGAFISRNSGAISSGSNVDFGITRLGVEGVYNITYDSYVDLRTGVSFLDASVKIGNAVISESSDAKPIFFGPGFGWIFPIMNKMQLAPNLHYSHFFATSGAESFNVFDVMMTLRYQF